MTRFLVTHRLNGERCMVESLDGYPAAEWLHEDVVARDSILLEQHKREMRGAVMLRLEAGFAAGFTPASGPLAGHTLQVRDQEDRTNWLTSQAAYKAAIDAGAGALPAATFRTAANRTIACTFAEGHQALLDMAAWGRGLMARSWALKDAIKGAADMVALDAIDIEAGWP